MPTTPTSFDSITLADLSFVQGGCGKKKCQCPPPAPPPQQAAPQPSGGVAIDTNVSITGYGQ